MQAKNVFAFEACGVDGVGRVSDGNQFLIENTLIFLFTTYFSTFYTFRMHKGRCVCAYDIQLCNLIQCQVESSYEEFNARKL